MFLLFHIISYTNCSRYTVNDPEFQRLMYLNRRHVELLMQFLVVDFLPLAGYLPLKRMFSSYADLISLFDEFMDFFREGIQEHKDSFQEGT